MTEENKNKAPIKKGSVFIHTSKGLFPYSLLEKAEINDKQKSKQLKEYDRWVAANDLIEPPYSPAVLLEFYESNPVFFRCVKQIAIDVVGLGWNLSLKEDQKENKQEYERINNFIRHPNKNFDESFRIIFEKALIDWGSIGYFGLEVVRNLAGEVDSFYHVPAYTIRVHKDKKKYCQIRNNKKIWFKSMYSDEDINTTTGKKYTGSNTDKANELIFYKNFYPKSDYYGVPNALAALGDIIGLIGVRDYNLAFFENYGVPAAIVVLKGDWQEGSDKKVSKYLNKDFKGASNAHRTLVVQQPDGVEFEYIPLAKDVKEAGFKLYENIRREDILMTYSMPPERVGIRIVGKLGGNVAEEAMKVYIESVIEPLQTDLEYIINEQLLQSEVYEFKFENIDIRNYTDIVERQNKQIEHGTKTPNEARKELGLSPYDGGDKFYIMSNLIEIGENETAKVTKYEKNFLDAQTKEIQNLEHTH